MAVTFAPWPLRPLHPLHAILLAFPFPLFLGALLSDLAYWSTFEIQWANFAQWLNAGGLVGGGLALVWALVSLIRGRSRRDRRLAIYFVALLAAWAVGFVNALVHAKDAWAIMPEALWLSAAATLLALVATWVGFTGFRVKETY